MIKLLLLIPLVLSFSCAMGRKVRLENFSYDLGKNAKITIHSLKRIEDKMEFQLLGISLEEQAVVIKADEIECGAGNTNFTKVSVSGDKNNIIIFPKTTYTEFSVTCVNETPVSEDDQPFIIFKNVYILENDTAIKTLDSKIKIKFK
jgi:hypothetical protein